LETQIFQNFTGYFYLGLVAEIILRSEKYPGTNSFLKTFLSTLDVNLNFQVLLERSD
jgi:hypothetical protein